MLCAAVGVNVPDAFMSPGAASGSPYGAGVGMTGSEQPPKILLMGARRCVVLLCSPR